MQARYRREVDGNYLVLSDQDFREKEFTLQMLMNNRPDCFLRLRLSNLNGQPVLLYEVTSLQPVSRIFERSGVGGKQLRMMLDGLENVQREARRYLLSPSDIVLDPEYIFYDQDRQRVRFLYVPQYGLKGEGSLKGLAEFLLRHLDHKDASAVSLGYAFYDKCSDTAANLSRILEELGSEQKGEEPEEEADIDHGKAIPSFGREYKAPASTGLECKTSASSGLDRKAPASPGQGRRISAPGGRAEQEIHPDKGIMRKAKGSDERSAGMAAGQSYEEPVNSILYPDRSDAPEKKSRKKRRLFNWKKDEWKGIILIAGTSLGCSVLFAVIVWFGKLDLTQTGGLFFGMIALVWLIYRAAFGNRKEKDIWAGELEDPDEEEAYLEALMTDVYSKGPGRHIPITGMEGALAGADPEIFSTQSVIQAERSGRKPGLEKGTEEVLETVFAGSEGGEKKQDPVGYTRVLGYAFTEKKLWLISEDMRRCRDLLIEGGRVRIGKRPDQVDLCIPLDVISRVHAQIRQTADGAYLQDLNSTNGTSINGKMMDPSQEQPIEEGDLVSFAGVRFTVRFKEA